MHDDDDDDTPAPVPVVVPVGEALGNLYCSLTRLIDNLNEWEVKFGKDAMVD